MYSVCQATRELLLKDGNLHKRGSRANQQPTVAVLDVTQTHHEPSIK